MDGKSGEKGVAGLAGLPLPPVLITVTTLLLLVSLVYFEYRMTVETAGIAGDEAGLASVLATKSRQLYLFAIVMISVFASAALMAYGRYERKLEYTVEERTGELRELNRFNQDIIDNSPIGLLTINRSGEIAYASPAMRQIAGVTSPKELVGLNVLELKSSRDAGLVGYFSMGLAGRAFDVDDVEYRSQTTGRRSVRHYWGVPILDENREVKSLLLLIEDVTEKKKAQSETGQMIDSMPTPIFVIDSEHRVRFWNMAMESLTGIAKTEVIATKNHWKAFYEEPGPTLADMILDKMTDRINELYERSGPSRLLPQAISADGCRRECKRDFSVAAAPVLDRQGAIVAVVEIVRASSGADE